MTSLSVADLLRSYNKSRDEWLGRDHLPVRFDKPFFAVKPDTNVPAAFKDAVEAAVKFRCTSYTLQDAVQHALQYLDVDVRDELTCCFGEIEFHLPVGAVGHVGPDIRVIFFTPHYLYGNPFRASDDTRAWNAERDGTELQLNELLAMIMASQDTFQNASAKPKEILVIIPNSNCKKIFWTAFTPVKEMFLTDANFRTPMKPLHIREMKGHVLTPNAEEIFNLINSFLAEPTQ